MTIFYIDPEGGDNSKDGKSFANRWKNFATSGNSPSEDGDEYRVIASPAAREVGSAVWEDNLPYVKLQTEIFKVLDPTEGNWIIDKSAWNLNILEDSGVIVADLLMNRGRSLVFTTNSGTGGAGVVCHRDLGGLMDLSAFSAISLVVNGAGSVPFDGMSLRLCSDTAGTVTVAEFPLPVTTSAKGAVLLTNGVALPANVRSLALATTGDPVTRPFVMTFQQIVAVKGVNDPLHISHSCLLSQQSEDHPEWLPVRGFSTENRVYLGSIRHGDSEDLYWMNWRGTTRTAQLWARNTIICADTAPAASIARTTASALKVTGGWDRVSMSERTGETWLYGRQAFEYPGIAQGVYTAHKFMQFAAPEGQWDPVRYRSIEVEGIGFAEWHASPLLLSTRDRVKLRLLGWVGIHFGFRTYGPDSDLSFGCATYGRSGPLCPVLPGGTYSRVVPYRGELKVTIDKLFCTSVRNYVPPANNSDDVLVTIKKVEGCNTGLSGFFSGGTNNFDLPIVDNMPGQIKVYGTTFRNNVVDVATARDFWLDSPVFLSNGGLPNITSMGDTYTAEGQTVRIDRLNGEAWNGQVIHLGRERQQQGMTNQVSRVPGKRSIVSEARTYQYRDYKVTPYYERAIFVPVKAGEETTVSAQIMCPDFGVETGLLGIATRAGFTPGVGDVEGMTVRDRLQWCRVVITFTSEVDALVPIFVKNLGCLGYVSEVGLDTSGVGPDEPIIPPEPEATDSLTFIPASGFVGHVSIPDYQIPGFSAGNSVAEQVLLTTGYTITNMSSGTVISSEGHAIGAVFAGVDMGDGTFMWQTFFMLDAGWAETPYTSLTVKMYDADDELIHTDTAIRLETAGEYEQHGLLVCVAAEPVAGQTYTLKLFR